jgi:hypothetical protein
MRGTLGIVTLSCLGLMVTQWLAGDAHESTGTRYGVQDGPSFTNPVWNIPK